MTRWMWVVRWLMLAALVAGCGSCTGREGAAVGEAQGESPDAPTAVLRVHVQWHDGEPASRVRAEVRRHAEPGRPIVPRFDHTDAEGRCAFELDEPGVFAVALGRPEGVVVPFQRVDVREGKTANVTIVIPEGIDVEGRVFDPRSVPVAGAVVSVSRRRAHEVCTTDADGRFALRDIASPQALLVQHPDFQASHVYNLLTDTRFVIELKDGPRSLRGVVRDADGAPVPHAAVKLRWHRWRGRHSRASDHCVQITRTDVEGRYEFDQLRDTRVTVSASVPKLEPTFVNYDLDAAGVHELDVWVTQGWEISGVVTDTTGAPVEGAWVYRGRDGPAFAETDGKGRYTLTSLRMQRPLLDKPLRVLHPDMVPLVRVDAFSLSESVEWNPVLQRGVEITGAVTGLDAQLDGRVFAEARRDGRIVKTSPVVNGRFRLRGLEDVEYTVTVGPSDRDFHATQSNVTAGSEPNLALHMEKIVVARLRGVLVSEYGQRPQMTVTCEGEPVLLDVDSSGVFDEELRPGTYHVEVVDKERGETRREEYVVELGAEEAVDLGAIQLFRRFSELIVDVALEEGVEEGDFEVRAIDVEKGWGTGRFEWSDEGELVASPVRAGDYAVTVRGQGIASAAYHVQVPEREAGFAKIAVRKGYELVLDVGTGDGGERASALELTVRDDAGVGVHTERLPLMMGSRLWTVWLAPGRYDVVVRDEVGESTTRAVEVTKDGASLSVHIP